MKRKIPNFFSILTPSPTRVLPSIGGPMSPLRTKPGVTIGEVEVRGVFSKGWLPAFRWSFCQVRILEFEEKEKLLLFSSFSFSGSVPSEDLSGLLETGPGSSFFGILLCFVKLVFALLELVSRPEEVGNQEGGGFTLLLKNGIFFNISTLLSGLKNVERRRGPMSQLLIPTVRRGRVEKVLNFVPVRNNELNFSPIPPVKVGPLWHRIKFLPELSKVFCLEGG